MISARFLLSSLAGLALLSASSLAQQAPAASGVPVQMVVTAEARRGAEVPAIAKQDVMVYQGRNRDQVTGWTPAQGENAGLEFFILLDDGSSMSLGTQLEDIRKFILDQPSSTEIGVAYMRNGAARIEQNLTSDHALAAKALRLPLGIRGVDASPYFSLSDLVKHWPQGGSRREVLMVSDGIDFYYGSGDLLDPYLAAAIEDAQRAGVLVSAIYNPGAGHFGHDYWRTYWGQIYLSKVADATGGEAYYIGLSGPPVAFAPYLSDLAGRLKNQYVLRFLARPQKKAGLQPVRVTTEATDVDLVSADRVYVPAAP